MKRIGRLFDQLTSRENLLAAVWRASRGNQQHLEVQRFRMSLDERLREIVVGIELETLEFETYREFEVRDTKTREIRAPSFRDRVIHQALIGVVGPVLELGAIHHSYACRLGRGQHAALRQARYWTRRGDWYGKIDVRKYYDSVDHEIVREKLSRRFREQRLLRLFDRLLASWAVAPGKGLPIGALTSQYLANFYLDGFDAGMKASGLCHRYMRYLDDIVVWQHEKLLPAVRECAATLLQPLRLEMKHGGEWNRASRGIPFLGFVIYPDRMRLGRSARRRLGRKYALARREFKRGLLTEREFQETCTSLFAHAQFGDDRAWRQALLLRQPLPESLG